MKHYWLGIKLLCVDIKISSRLLLKLAGWKSLSRRERQQLTRTTANIFRLVPVAVFIIVPFMEFLLPVFLKLFSNMLPSTFQDKMKEQGALKRRLNARIEYAKFLQDTVKEIAKEVQNTRSGDIKKTAEDLDDFLGKVRSGALVANEEILGFAKLFNDELTLDNISRSFYIRELNLAHCGLLTDGCLQAIGRFCPFLRLLNVSYLDNLTDFGLCYLADGCKSLKTFNIAHTRFRYSFNKHWFQFFSYFFM